MKYIRLIVIVITAVVVAGCSTPGWKQKLESDMDRQFQEMEQNSKNAE